MTINYDLIQSLADKPHPLLHISDDFEAQLRGIPPEWVGEIFTSARTAHHLLDMVGIPRGEGYASDLDSRTWQAINVIVELRQRLDRITSWHSGETADGGLVGYYCTECGESWPCDTRRMADGTHNDEVAP